MWPSIVLVMLLGETADGTAPQCGWWQRDDSGSWVVPRVTPSSGVLLPLRLERGFPVPYGRIVARLEPGDLDVVVKDAAGQIHAGRLQWEDAYPEVFAEGFPHERDLWWEPLAPLAEGSYSAEIKVGSPPRRGSCADTGYQPWATTFEDVMTFTVRTELPPVPTITIEAAFETGSLAPGSFSTARTCPDGKPCATCEGRPGVVCFVREPERIGRALRGQITLAGFELGPLRSYIFNVRVPGSQTQSERSYSTWGTLPGETHVPLEASMIVTDPTLEFELYAFVTRGRMAFASARLEVQGLLEPQCLDEACAACQASEAACGPVVPPWEQPDPDPHIEGEIRSGCQGSASMTSWLLGLSVWVVFVARRRSRQAR